MRHWLQHLVDDHDLLVARRSAARRRVVVVEVLVVDDHVDVAQLAELAQLERRELHLRRAAAAEDVHVGDGRGLRGPSYDVRGISVGSRSSACLASMRATSSATLPLPMTATDCARRAARCAGQSGWPSNQLTKSAAPYEPVEVDARDVERRVADRAGREDHGVVVLLQVVERDVLAEAHVAEDADVAAVEHLAQGRDDALDARVVGRDAVAHEAVGRGQVLEQVDRDVEVAARP